MPWAGRPSRVPGWPARSSIVWPTRAGIGAAGYGVTLRWTCDPRDSLGATGAEILANCIENARPGRIVLLHVGAQSAAYDVLPETLDRWAAQGLTPVRVDELVRPAGVGGGPLGGEGRAGR